MEDLSHDEALLSVLDYSALPEDDQEDACKAANHVGMNSVEAVYAEPVGAQRRYRRPSTEIVENPSPYLYYRYCVEPLARSGKLPRETVNAWREYVGGPPDRLDPRVAAFLDGWRVRGRELIQVAEGRSILDRG